MAALASACASVGCAHDAPPPHTAHSVILHRSRLFCATMVLGRRDFRYAALLVVAAALLVARGRSAEGRSLSAAAAAAAPIVDATTDVSDDESTLPAAVPPQASAAPDPAVPAAPTLLRLGCLLPLSGDKSNTGKAVRAAVEMAIRDYTRLPGVNITLQCIDSKCGNVPALRGSLRLVRSNVGE